MNNQTCIRIYTVLVVACTCLLGGCFSYHRATGERLSSVPMKDHAWPAFETVALTPLLDTPEVIERAHVDKEKYQKSTKETYTSDMLQALQDYYTDDLLVKRLDEHGLTRVWKPRLSTKKTHEIPMLFSMGGFVDEFVRNAQYLTGPMLDREEAVSRIREQYGPKPIEIHLGKYFGITYTDVKNRWHLISGMEMAVPAYVADDSPGLIIHITSLEENEYEHALTDRLEHKGYAIAYLDSNIFLPGPNQYEQVKRDAQREAYFQTLQQADPKNPYKMGQQVPRDIDEKAYERLFDSWSQQADEKYPPLQDGLQVYPDTDIQQLGQEIASEVDTVIAQHAYAVDGLVHACDEIYPSLQGKPIIVLGYSAGTLPAPAIARRLKDVYPDRSILLVMIGGGGDALTIARTSLIGDIILNLVPNDGPPPTPAQLDELEEAYLEHVALDPLIVAKSIREIPVLHVFGKRDTMVPTSTAIAFNNAHGHVDCIVHSGGHGTLFYFIDGQAGRIDRWIKHHINQ